ncbi:MAG: hypothetical protein HY291_03930 [Planctomycetes bacterium]|nr:hypothetical protein [Planctomycetota bacterium]
MRNAKWIHGFIICAGMTAAAEDVSSLLIQSIEKGEAERLSRLNMVVKALAKDKTYTKELEPVKKELQDAKGLYLSSLRFEEGSVGVYRNPMSMSDLMEHVADVLNGRLESGDRVNSAYGNVKSYEGGNVLQVIDGKNLLMTVSEKRIIWVSNFDTSKLVDGNGLLLEGIFLYKGTKKYDTAIASKTVHWVEYICKIDDAFKLAAKKESDQKATEAERLAVEEKKKQEEQIRNAPVYVMKDGRKIKAVKVEDIGKGKLILRDENNKA